MTCAGTGTAMSFDIVIIKPANRDAESLNDFAK
ncbi:UNVERIFIED_ORG: hypothetical protein BDU10_6165 [Burkholderia sp. CF145]